MRRTVLSAALGAVVTAALALPPTPALAADPPPNDDFNNNTVLLSQGGTVSGSNVGATAQSGEPNHAGATFEGEPLGAVHSVWWSWDATSSGEAKISTCGSGFNTRLAVYTGDALDALQPVASALDGNDGSCDSRFAGVTFTATKDTIYRIAVDTEGGLAADGTGDPWGSIQLTVTPPPGSDPPPPPPGDDDTNPGTQVAEEPVSVTVPRFKPICDQERSKSKADCPDDATGFKFYSAEPYQDWQGRYDSVRRWVDKQVEKRGADITYITKAMPAGQTYGTLRDYLFKKGAGGEVLVQNVAPGTEVETTSDHPLVLKIKYFDPAEDRKIMGATMADIKDSGDGRKDIDSPCKFIRPNPVLHDILAELTAALGGGTLTQKRAGEILAGFGCGYEVPRTFKDANGRVQSGYIDGPGFTTDTVMAVVGVDKDRDLIQLQVALPVQQDFAFVISEEPEFAEPDILGLGLDGKLTASQTQVNRITVQVLERTTGRLVPGVKLDFYGPDGKPLTETTNAMGEWTFTSLMPVAGRYALKATYVGANGATMVGFRSIDVVDRKASYMTMTGRTIAWDGQRYAGDANEIFLRTEASADRSDTMYLPVVTGNLGTGLTGVPTAPPSIEQIQVAEPSGGTFVVGQHNGIHLPNDTNFLVGTDSGFVAIGGGTPPAATAGPVAGREWPNPFQKFTNWLGGILGSAQKAIASGVGSSEKYSPNAPQVDKSVDTLKNNDTAMPDGAVTQQWVGLIGQAGGNLIGQAGGNVIGTGGLNSPSGVIATGGGNCISTGGANRPAHGRAATGGVNIGKQNVISLEKDMMPVYGGNVIATS